MLNQNKIKKAVATLLIVSLTATTVGPVLLWPKPASALIPSVSDIFAPLIYAVNLAVKINNEITKVYKKIGDLGFRNALKNFMHKLAYDTAVFVATGDKGQSPLFQTSFKDYIKEVGDGYLGDAINDIWGRGDLCQPIAPLARVKVEITARRILEPPKPRCRFSQIVENIKDLRHLKLVDMPDFADIFNPSSNELGMVLTVVTTAEEGRRENEELAKLTLLVEQGWKSIRSTITSQIKTPWSHIEFAAEMPFLGALSEKLVYTGSPLADFIEPFTNTLISKLFERIKEGFNPQADVRRAGGGLAGFFGASGGIAAARLMFAELAIPDFNVGGPIDLLTKLASCPIATTGTGGPEQFNCIIDEKFRIAIEQKMTVKEAIERGLLEGKRPFGFTKPSNTEPDYRNGYPYRSLLVLRKYRIIPVGFELAAKYFKEFDKSEENLTLNKLIDKYNDPDSPYYRLVDPYWVLKAPETICQREGPGPENISYDQAPICDEDTNQDGEIKCLPDRAKPVISRRDYCADERSCIVESEDGRSCLFYGYCTEEKPIWRIEGDQCKAYYNTCQTYVKRQGGTIAYLTNTLNKDDCGPENAGCRWYCSDYNNVDGVWGCVGEGSVYKWCGDPISPPDHPYSSDGWYGTGANARTCLRTNPDNPGDFCYIQENGIECITPSGYLAHMGIAPDQYESTIHLNKQAKTCDASQEGCDEYMRIALGTFNNLIPNSSFEFFGPYNNLPGSGTPDDEILDYFDGWWIKGTDRNIVPDCGAGGFASTDAYLGDTALKIERLDDCSGTDPGFYFAHDIDTGHSILNRTFTTSYYAKYAKKVDSGNSCSGTFNLKNGEPFNWTYYPAETANYTDSWQRFSQTVVIDALEGGTSPINPNRFVLIISVPDPADCTGLTIDGVQIEEGELSLYKNYQENNKIYLNSKKVECASADVNCEFYSPVSYDGPDVPGVITSQNTCPSECVGYKNYKEESTYFDPQEDFLNFIAKTAKTCPAADEGCEEFTNLDEVAKGGEGREYYTYLRYCIKPGFGEETYYTWEGSDTTGYQLKVWQLLKSNVDSGPCTNAQSDPAGNVSCNDAGAVIQRCGPETPDPGDDLSVNPDCREFYDTSANIYYRLQSHTIFASDDCHPYRRTVDQTIRNAIPSQGTHCSPSSVGCREYKGPAANNLREIIRDDFEDGTNQDWNGGKNSTMSIIYGGHSLETTETSISKSVAPTSNRVYILSFWAKGAGTLTIKFENAPSGSEFTTSLSLNPDWRLYNLGPVFVTSDWPILPDNKIEFNGFTSTSYLDNIILKETTEDLFLIKNSWQTPLTCDTDPPLPGGTAPYNMLGCEEYKNRFGDSKYLKDFTRLCEEKHVGCEALIDTHNSSSPFEEWFNNETTLAVDDVDDVKVEADEISYFVNDRAKYCTQKGCQKLSLATQDRDTNEFTFQTKYLILDPDQYEQSLCKTEEVMCEEYTVAEGPGKSYFKDPQDKTCEYKEVKGIYAWYKSGTGEPCPAGVGHCLGGRSKSDLTQNTCPLSSDCIDYTDFIGEGLCSSWVGLCPSHETGCREYQDPQEPKGCEKGNLPSQEEACNFYYYKKVKECETGEINPLEGCVGFNQTDNPEKTLVTTRHCVGDPPPIESKRPCELDIDCGDKGPCGYE